MEVRRFSWKEKKKEKKGEAGTSASNLAQADKIEKADFIGSKSRRKGLRKRKGEKGMISGGL